MYPNLTFVGSDCSRPKIDEARRKAEEQGLEADFRISNLEDYISERKGGFDFVTAVSFWITFRRIVPTIYSVG
jgi:2-polyprenyl-3-methyl-5-hydroxy-6-metoxy-1,4-benzoquinol methylase